MTYCSICGKGITKAHFDECQVADIKVYEYDVLTNEDVLDQILLAHAWCALNDHRNPKWEVGHKDGYKWVKNIRSGKWIQIAEDTPRCCDPSTELYHAM